MKGFFSSVDFLFLAKYLEISLQQVKQGSHYTFKLWSEVTSLKELA
jgi:hypothetical protein